MALPSTKKTKPEAKASAELSEQDVEALLNGGGYMPRINVLQKIADEYNDELLRGHEMLIAEQMFRSLMEDPEVEVRKVLAANIKENHVIPRDIVKAMVRDVDSVALPMLRFSPVLKDTDLLPLVRGGIGQSRMIAIAGRRGVSMPLSSALAGAGKPAVAETLVKNMSASISDATMLEIFDSYPRNAAITSGLVSRHDLPPVVVEKLLPVVGPALSKELEEKYAFGAQVPTSAAELSREETHLKKVMMAQSELEIEHLASQLDAFSRLTPSLVIMALCKGYKRFFDQSLIQLSNLPRANAEALLNDRGDLGLRALYARARMPESFFGAIKLVIEIVRDALDTGHQPASPELTEFLIDRMLYLSEGKEIENLPYIIAVIRQALPQ